MTVALWCFLAGIGIRTLFIFLPGSGWKDIGKVGAALAAGLVIVAQYSSETQTTASENTIAFAVAFCAVIAFAYRHRIIPRITEGMLFLCGLVALYTLHAYADPASPLVMWGMWILAAYSAAAFVVCLLHARVRPLLQIVFVACFLASNVLLASVFLWGEFDSLFCTVCAAPLSPLSAALVGYTGFMAISNILYILYFIPIPLSKHESFSERFENIRIHAAELRKRYVDEDAGSMRTLLIFGLCALLYGNEVAGIVDTPTAITLVLALGELAARPHRPPAS